MAEISLLEVLSDSPDTHTNSEPSDTVLDIRSDAESIMTWSLHLTRQILSCRQYVQPITREVFILVIGESGSGKSRRVNQLLSDDNEEISYPALSLCGAMTITPCVVGYRYCDFNGVSVSLVTNGDTKHLKLWSEPIDAAKRRSISGEIVRLGLSPSLKTNNSYLLVEGRWKELSMFRECTIFDTPTEEVAVVQHLMSKTSMVLRTCGTMRCFRPGSRESSPSLSRVADFVSLHYSPCLIAMNCICDENMHRKPKTIKMFHKHLTLRYLDEKNYQIETAISWNKNIWIRGLVGACRDVMSLAMKEGRNKNVVIFQFLSNYGEVKPFYSLLKSSREYPEDMHQVTSVSAVVNAVSEFITFYWQQNITQPDAAITKLRTVCQEMCHFVLVLFVQIWMDFNKHKNTEHDITILVKAFASVQESIRSAILERGESVSKLFVDFVLHCSHGFRIFRQSNDRDSDNNNNLPDGTTLVDTILYHEDMLDYLYDKAFVIMKSTN